ncbi:MAG TPA: cupin domain-containing protein [Chitinophagaceae bacterium]|nr:cupin domain-containing protein [Chitinophagaceae bacterium]
MTTIAKLLRSSTVILPVSVAFLNCSDNKNSAPELKESASKENLIFPRGDAGLATNFTGKAYNYGLVANDSVYNTLVGNVYFEPGARSNWHKHPAGQILIITDGEGYHQIEGQPKQTMKKGDVIKCPPNVRHWHGASENSSLSQLYIISNTDKGIVEWQEPVTDEQYKLGK